MSDRLYFLLGVIAGLMIAQLVAEFVLASAPPVVVFPPRRETLSDVPSTGEI